MKVDRTGSYPHTTYIKSLWFWAESRLSTITIQRCMGFTEKIVVGKISVKVMHSGKVMSDCTVHDISSKIDLFKETGRRLLFCLVAWRQGAGLYDGVCVTMWDC